MSMPMPECLRRAWPSLTWRASSDYHRYSFAGREENNTRRGMYVWAAQWWLGGAIVSVWRDNKPTTISGESIEAIMEICGWQLVSEMPTRTGKKGAFGA